MADKLQGDVIPVEPGFLNYVQREPLGVVGQIVPWNFPLMSAATGRRIVEGSAGNLKRCSWSGAARGPTSCSTMRSSPPR